MNCPKCLGTGKSRGFKYCDCMVGRELLKGDGMKLVKLFGREVMIKDVPEPIIKAAESVEVDTSNLDFQVDDWVEIANGKMKGYVVKIDLYMDRACVQITRNYKDNFMGRIWINFALLIKTPQESDPNILIDLALATRDEQWFTQLTRGME